MRCWLPCDCAGESSSGSKNENHFKPVADVVKDFSVNNLWWLVSIGYSSVKCFQPSTGKAELRILRHRFQNVQKKSNDFTITATKVFEISRR